VFDPGRVAVLSGWCIRHRKVGEALEALADVDPDTRVDELAHHWLAATQVADAAKRASVWRAWRTP
jgi:hypothetical protein